MTGCGSGQKVAGSCSSGFKVQFAITSVKDSLPLDTLNVKIALGDTGSPENFVVNLKTGVSSAAITATQGEAYRLTFSLYSAGYLIASGESQGKLACDLSVDLNPVWNDTNIVKAKKDLGLGIIFPAWLPTYFSQAVPGKVYQLPLDSLHNTSYRWYIKSGDSTLMQGEGAGVRITFPDSLAGKTVTIRLQAVSGSIIKEERIWNISILSVVSQDKILRILEQTDTTVQEGISLTFLYDSLHLTAVESFDSLSSTPDQKPAAVESLYYNGAGQLTRTHAWLPDSAGLDSVFAYDEAGNLASLQVLSGTGKTVDSLSYQNGKLSASRRYVNGTLEESTRFNWDGADERDDSVSTPGSSGMALTRVIVNRYQSDSLSERDVLVWSGGLTPYTQEIIVYNGLGSRAYRNLFLQGSTPTLEQSDTYAYDAKGRVASMVSTDEVTSDLILQIRYQYAPGTVAGKVAASMRKTHAVTALHSVLNVLTDIRFAHSGWELKKHPRTARK